MVKPAIERELLGHPKTEHYKPTVSVALPAWGMTGGWGVFNLGVIDEMRRDYQVRQSLAMKLAPLSTATFEFEAGGGNAQAILKFAEREVDRYWSKSLGTACECMPFGYSGSEPMYREVDGTISFNYLKPLHPRDIKPWTVHGELSFVQVKNLSDPDAEESGGCKLRAAQKNIPAKGYWCSHEPKYSRWYGFPLGLSMWWPWRLKCMPDGAMENLFKAFYKYAYNGMTIRHPDDAYEDSVDGTKTTPAVDLARQLAQWAKTGANIILNNRRDAQGEYEWVIESYGGESMGSFEPLMEYPERLDRWISRGAMIPDLILTQAGETGSYSRANIAWLAFILMAEEYLNHHLEAFVDQILLPLVRLNFGSSAWVKVKPKPLMMEQVQQATGEAQKNPMQPPGPGAQQPEVPNPNAPAGLQFSTDAGAHLSPTAQVRAAEEKHWGKILLEEAVHVRIVGPSGCLHGSTPIYDPVDGTCLPVEERHRIGKKFSVYSLGEDGPVVGQAMPPARYQPTPMVEFVIDDGQTFTVTADHRFWNGSDFVTAREVCASLRQSGVCHLPTISAFDLSTRLQDAPRSTSKAEGSLADCRAGRGSCGGQLLTAQGGGQSGPPSQVDAQARSRSRCNWDDRDGKGRHIPCGPSGRLSSHDSLAREGAPSTGSGHLPGEGPCECIACSSRAVSPLETHTPNGSSCSKMDRRSEWSNDNMIWQRIVSAREIPAEPYYDFHVAVHHNYWACGLFHHNSGKSMLAQALAANVPGKVFIIDPVWEPGNWGGLPAVTVSREEGEYWPIREAVGDLIGEMKRRGQLLQQGVKEFERLTVICDEVPDTVTEVPEMGLLIRRLGQRGRHGNMHLVGIGQSDRVGSWGIAGYGDAAENFATVYLGDKAIEVMPELKGRDRAGALEWRGKWYPLDLHEVAELAKRAIPPDRLFKLPHHTDLSKPPELADFALSLLEEAEDLDPELLADAFDAVEAHLDQLTERHGREAASAALTEAVASAALEFGFDEGKHPRGQPENAGEFAPKGQGKQPRAKQAKGAADPDAHRPSRPENRHNVAPPVKKFKPPPAPSGAGRGKAGGFTANGETNTAMGDRVEELTARLGLRSILPEGQRHGKSIAREGSTLDREYDHSGWAFEVKAVSTTAKEYKAKPKAFEMEGKRRYAQKHGLKPATMIAVYDAQAGEVHCYWRPGIGAFRLKPNETGKDWNYMGTVKVAG